MPKLVIAGTSHEIVDRLITVGRAPDNVIVLDEPSVSSHHAQLERVGDSYRLSDLQSTNGTRVNGVQVSETILRPGDRVRFGGIDAQYEPDASGSQPLPDVAQIAAAPAENSAAPVDFTNASPFPARRKNQDRTRTAVFAAAGIAAIAFLISMIAVLIMHAPTL